MTSIYSPYLDESADVRSTIKRLRWSIIGISAALLICMVIAVGSTVAAWQLGMAAGEAGSGGAIPPKLVFVAMLLTFAAVAYIGVRFVQAPYAAAVQQARELAASNAKAKKATLETFAALNAAVEAKDKYTAGHGLRVTLISILIGQELGLDEVVLDNLRHAATFHDIGKIAVPDRVLQNPGRLSDGDFEQMKVHSTEGARICAKLEVLEHAVPMIRSHHERFDGRGYPDGLTAERIPIGARIIAVADAWDAITSDRPYRSGQPSQIALQEIRRNSGTQFDERIVRAFVDVLAKDPWMFGLEPEDLTADLRPLPAPTPTSRGAHRDLDQMLENLRKTSDENSEAGEPDWGSGFDDEDTIAA